MNELQVRVALFLASGILNGISLLIAEAVGMAMAQCKTERDAAAKAAESEGRKYKPPKDDALALLSGSGLRDTLDKVQESRWKMGSDSTSMNYSLYHLLTHRYTATLRKVRVCIYA